MIGMMYLVYTALLALNVSAEVLKSFVTVNEALEITNENYRKKIEFTYNTFQRAFFANETKVEDKWNKALQVKEKSAEMYNFIEETKWGLIAASEGIPLEEAKVLNPRDIAKQDNYDDPTRFFVGLDEAAHNGKGYELVDKLNEYREFLINILGDDAEEVNLEALQTDGDYKNASGQQVDWVYYNFYHAIIVADLALLNRVQASVLNAEYDVVAKLYSAVSEDDFKFDSISARVVPVSNNVLLGSPYEADIFVAAFDSKSKISATINGQTYTGEGGSIHYKVPTTSLGDRKVSGTIEIPGTFGVKSYPFDFSYSVGQASASVAATKMNVFYVGVDNPVSALGGGVSERYTDVTISNGTITKTGPGTYNVRVNTPGQNAVISVYSTEGKKRTLMGEYTFRVKRVPNPEARINGQEVGVKQIDKNTLANAGGLLVSMKDFDFELNLQISSFNVQVSRKQELSASMPSNGNKFSPTMIDNFKRCSRGDKVFITDITAKMPDGNRLLGDMILTIK